jgi:hypothetical protein
MEFFLLTKTPLKQGILTCLLHAIYGSQIKGMPRLKFNFFFNYEYNQRNHLLSWTHHVAFAPKTFICVVHKVGAMCDPFPSMK